MKRQIKGEIMNKEEQIEEMQQNIMGIGYEYGYDTNEFVGLSEKLYNAGYRKVFPIRLCNTTEEDIDLTEDDAINEKICEDCQNKTRKQVVKEFAEKLKKKVHNYYPSIDSYCTSRHVILVKDIDDLLKEYEDERI